MRNLVSALVLFLVLASAACSAESPTATPSGELATRVGVPGKRMLPAFVLPEERAARKADGVVKQRGSHWEWYAITVPPAVPGFRAMQEWEPMQANAITYSDFFATPFIDEETEGARTTLVDIAVATLQVADLWVLYQSTSARSDLSQRLLDAGIDQRTLGSKVHFYQVANDAMWLIDYGPLPLVDPATDTMAFLDFRYYEERELDDAIPTRLGKLVDATTYRLPFNFEGGNFQADGEGVCYTTQRAFAEFGTEDELRTVLRYYAGCRELVVLRDIWNDGTGHIDMLFKLVSPTVAIVGSFTNAQDSQAKADMDWNAAQLEGRGMTVYRMPMPNGVDTYYGFVPRTYLNSTFVNGPGGRANLWPVYSVDSAIQAQAEAVWEAAMPDWTHVPILSDEISSMSGAIHCVTRTIPAKEIRAWVADGTCTGGRCTAPAGGYDGACYATADCTGPTWLCGTNDCPFDPTGCVADGECDDANACTDDLCYNGTCQNLPHCRPGEICDPETGSCSTCVPDCEGRSCGDNGCGGTCGECTEGTCFVGVCMTDCGSLPYEGCCDGAVAWYCDPDRGLTAIDCPVASEGQANLCTWTGADGYFCAAEDMGDDPDGRPRDCAAYVSRCASDSECDDADVCTTDTCMGGTCAHTAIAGCCHDVADCDDRDHCTTDTCDVAHTCQHAPVTGCTAECSTDFDCQDEDDCTSDFCSYEACLHIVVPGCGATCTADADCYDADECTTDTCAAGTCQNAGIPGCGAACAGVQECDDGNPCTGDTCTEGECHHRATPNCTPCAADADCNDNDPCTTDVCGPNAICGITPIPSCCTSDADCEDDDACTEATCAEMTCSAQTLVTCPQGETCDPAVGCVPVCTPDCRNKECGDNGCGGICGSCPEGEQCDARGVCVDPCACIGIECGHPVAGCAPCGECEAGETCNFMNQCVPADEPDVVTEDTASGDTAGGDTAGRTDVRDPDGNGGGGGGCAAAPTAASPAGGVLALLLGLGVAVVRRRRAPLA